MRCKSSAGSPPPFPPTAIFYHLLRYIFSLSFLYIFRHVGYENQNINHCVTRLFLRFRCLTGNLSRLQFAITEEERFSLAIALTSRMVDLSRPVTGNCILDKECGMGPRIKEGAMRWQRHLVSRNPRKSGLRKSALIPRLIR